MRRYRGRVGAFDFSDLIYPFWGLGDISLRQYLESVAEDERSFTIKDCKKWYGHKYKWKAEFQQTWTHIEVRIKLNPKNEDVEDAIEDDGLKDLWRTGMRDLWNAQWAASRDGELSCRFTFNIQWVSSGHHKKVKVKEGPTRSNMTTWDTDDTGSVVAHEVGHMIGHEDEYASSDCPDRDNVGDGTVMESSSSTASMPSRLYSGFASHIGSSVVSP